MITAQFFYLEMHTRKTSASELNNPDSIAKNLDHIAVAKFGALAALGLAIKFNNAILDKLVGLRPTLADSQQLNKFVQFDVRFSTIRHWF